MTVHENPRNIVRQDVDPPRWKMIGGLVWMFVAGQNFGFIVINMVMKDMPHLLFNVTMFFLALFISLNILRPVFRKIWNDKF